MGEHKKVASYMWVMLLFPPRFSTTMDQLNFLWQLMKLFASLQSILALSCCWNWREWQKTILACLFQMQSSLCQQSLMKGNGILPLRQLILQVMHPYSSVFLGNPKVCFSNSKVFGEGIDTANQWWKTSEGIFVFCRPLTVARNSRELLGTNRCSELTQI